MARKKEYDEAVVLEKAMTLFWRNGYEATSVRMLEKEMGINQFSMYSSFKSKNGVFLESIKVYREKLREITDVLVASNNGVEGIQEYFYNFIDFSRKNEKQCGCLITNTANEIGEETDPAIKKEVLSFMTQIRSLFLDNLRQDTSKNEALLEKQANYLIISIAGLANATKMFNQEQLHDYITLIFKNI
ncbi:TetR/AcrR family transcriptional regulator [Spongiimicrobium salis]|uniref:TetR/AcrR family transcriptional regulator n=1 Tax=Spongiimicrobium salis TaxID=1667022 RepID=UPI00374CA50D